MHIIKVLVLGASGVGKTSIVQQFTANEFPKEHNQTVKASLSSQTVMLENQVYQLKILDLPPLNSFPMDSLEEWGLGISLRSASAYILVYDASNIDSFHHIKMLRDQICESRDIHVPLLVVANKSDLISTPLTNTGHGHHNHHGHHHRHGVTLNSSESERRDIYSTVRKQWKVPHLECSAKYNFRIVSIFKELTRLCLLLEMTHSKDTSTLHLPHNIENFHRDVLHRENCSIS